MKLFISLVFLVLMFSSCQQPPSYKEFPWKPYSQKAVEESIAHKKPVVIDFWASWCPNCRDMDRAVFSRPDIQAKLSQVTTLRMDVTNQDDPRVQRIADQFGIEGVPTVVFLNSHGKEIENARVIGFVTPAEFMQALALLNIFK
ncbi:MAG: thioredoxin fold domain-containing protein [Candidatus Omnitrophica bacterium]|nr:thioredoxin fold domain-containing protein [Candidatus Omnitrophota bacterium]MDE2009731.1 thioredoxin fold domain-containing protein [Candidatus Omnitrophota bacterium]MDE2213872.1 thioredoxin fold domain-containing protein [Candidatus Omnitrophota bacterium]MDE2231869.1 thioredoxin fold domain-containing protein [Candidatus Omnitrophota bacterium]